MTSPTATSSPSPRRIFWITPPWKHSSSMTALSHSISASTSPSLTRSPSCTFHSMILPSSMLSESLGIVTSYMARPSW